MAKKAVIYARYSCDKQNEQSIEGQLRVCNEFAQRNGYLIVHNYIDRAVSGKTDHRNDFQKMLKDSANHSFEYVIVYKLDRFARNRYDSAINKALLKKNGVKVLSACEQITDSPEGIILESMIEGYAEYYSAELAQKVKRGMRESCIKGNAAGIKPLFGYGIVNKKYVVIDSEAVIVRKIFDDYVSGKQIKEIAAWLKGSGIKTHGENDFSIGRLSSMLHSRKYIGECYYGGEVYDNVVPQIIDNETFEQVQRRLAVNARKSARAKATEPFILSGKMVCAECGALMTGESGTSGNGGTYLYYKCSRKKTKSTNCKSHAIKKELIENRVYEEIIKALGNDDFISKVAAKTVEIHNSEIEEPRELKILKKQKAEVERKLVNITEAICNGIFNEMTQSKMVELSNLKENLEIKISEEEARVIEPMREARVISFLKNYTKIIRCAEKPESLEGKKMLFDTFIKKIIFDGERVLIEMKTTDEPERIEENGEENDENGEELGKNGKKKTSKKATRKKFELLSFGDPAGNRTRD